MNRRGGLVMGLYLVAALVTAALAGHHLLPLFEGFSPPPPYHWVKPPSLFAPGNIVPAPVSAVIAFAAGQSTAVSFATADGQCSVSLAAGSLLLPGGDRRTEAVLVAVDPGPLSPLPSGLFPDGNAYRLGLTGQPSARPIVALDAPGNLVLTAPEPIRTLFYSPDGRSWQTQPTHTVGDATVAGSTFSRAGIYLAATAVDPATSGSASGPRHTAGTTLVALIVVALTVALLVVPASVRRLLGRGE